MNTTYESWRITFQTSEQAARAAFDRVSELERDAARYRWLRKPESGNVLYAMVVGGECGRNMDITIDQYIDAAAQDRPTASSLDKPSDLLGSEVSSNQGSGEGVGDL